MSPSIWQILIVVGLFVLLFYGPKKIPGIGKSMGEAIRGFKKGLNEDEVDITDSQKQGRIDQDEDKATQTSTEKEKDKDKV